MAELDRNSRCFFLQKAKIASLEIMEKDIKEEFIEQAVLKTTKENRRS